MDVKEFARLGGKARAKKLGVAGLKAHAAKMVEARKRAREDNEAGDNQRSQPDTSESIVQ